MEGVFCFPVTKVQMLTYISLARSRLGVRVLVCGGLLLFRRGGGRECLAVGGFGGASTCKPTCNTHTLASATSWRRMAVDRYSFYLLLVQNYKILRLPSTTVRSVSSWRRRAVKTGTRFTCCSTKVQILTHTRIRYSRKRALEADDACWRTAYGSVCGEHTLYWQEDCAYDGPNVPRQGGWETR